jgi:hypothetical protein
MNHELCGLQRPLDLLDRRLHREDRMVDADVGERHIAVGRVQDAEHWSCTLRDLEVLADHRQHGPADVGRVCVAVEREPREEAEVGLDVLGLNPWNLDGNRRTRRSGRQDPHLDVTVRLHRAEVDRARRSRQRNQDEQRANSRQSRVLHPVPPSLEGGVPVPPRGWCVTALVRASVQVAGHAPRT